MSMKRKCVTCGFISHSTPMVVIYDPARPKGAKRKDYIIGYHCDQKKCEPLIKEVKP